MGKQANNLDHKKRTPTFTGERQDNRGTASAVSRIAQMIRNTHEDEASCDEVDSLLDQFAELVQRREDVEEIMPLVKNHIDLCPECREEFEALLRILENDQD
jgi:hypothetical protein